MLAASAFRILRALPRAGLRRTLQEARGKLGDRVHTSRAQEAEAALVRASQLFDAEYYLRQCPGAGRPGRDPVRHFIRFGWRTGLQPHPLFDLAFYLAANPDVARAEVNPLVHYAGAGWREGRDPHVLFSTRHYLAANPDVASAGVNPLVHFAGAGWREGRSPHPLFDVRFYLTANPDVARAGVNPLVHYVGAGWRQGYDPHPLFSTSHYLATYPDVAAAGVEPLAHFVTAGWRDGRVPHPVFDPAFYASDNPEVTSEVNPLVHFVTEGMRQGRPPSALFDDALELPLPGAAWEPGASTVERVVRTFIWERATPLTPGRRGILLGDMGTRAAGQDRLRGPDSDRPEVSIVIPVFNQLKFTLWCLYAVLAGTYGRTFEVVVVDDGSDDGTDEALAALPQVRHVRSDTNRGFVHSCNLGAQHARGEFIVFLNNDTLPLQGWLDALVDTLRDRPQSGLVGAKLIYPDGRLQEAGGIVWQNGAPWNCGRGGDRRPPELNYRRGVDFCSGAAIAVEAALFREAGGFDEAFAPAYGEDVDLALRLRQRGRAPVYQPLAEVVHFEGVTAGTSTRTGVKTHQVGNLKRLFERWGHRLRAHRPEGQEAGLEKDRDAERRALFVDAFTPRPDQDAGSLDALHWMQSLGELGFQVTFLPYFDRRHAGRYSADLQRQGIECLYEPYAASAEEFLAARGADFDLCLFYRYEVADALLPVIKVRAPQARRLLALCDLAHVRTQRQVALTGSERGRRMANETKLRELLACTQCDVVWTPSEWERERLLQEVPGTDVFAWPLPQDLRPPRNGWGQRSGIGFIGGYRHAPNVDAVLYFVREILPRVLELDPAIVFHVAGSHMPAEIAGITHPSVRVLGQVADLRPFFEGLRATVAPIRFGAGMKGKVAASLASGVPVVGTSLALEGMGLGAEEGVLGADDPEAFARAVVRLHGDEEAWNRLSRAGFERAERDYSRAAGTRHVGRALVHLGLRTRRTDDLLGGSIPSESWLRVPGMRIDVCRSRDEYLALRSSEEYRSRVAFEERLLEEAAGGAVAYRARSLPAGRPVVYGAMVVERNGRPWSGWREELVCPYTGLNNRQRAMAAFAERLVTGREPGIDRVYLTEQVTPLFKWMSGRFQTVGVTGSEYLGPDARPGEVRDGIQHEDIERLSLASSSVDLVLSGDVLEHVNEPRAALAELSRVLRPGGHLLFTVPFSWDREANRRRARGVGDSVEHLVDPCYHGNPLDPNGSLAYFDFGWELLDWIREAGFADVSLICYWSDALGHLGGLLEVFHAVR